MADLPLPAFPGVKFRKYHGPEDIPDLLAVHVACQERDQLDLHSVCYRLPFLTPQKYAAQITLPDATLIAEANERVIAHGFLEAWGIEERLYLWRVWVRPEWRGRGLGTLMHRWGEACSRHMHGADARPGIHLANATEYEADATELLRHEGYHLSFVSPELAFDVTDSLPEPTPPPPIILRPLEASAAVAVAVARALCEANLSPPGRETLFTPQTLEERLNAQADEWNTRVGESDTALSVVAWDGEQVAGAYLCRRNGTVGEIAQVAVRAPWRGQGIARALALRSLHNLKAAGCTTARLFTSINPDDLEPTQGPYTMYRKFGFYHITRHLRFRKPMP